MSKLYVQTQELEQLHSTVKWHSRSCKYEVTTFTLLCLQEEHKTPFTGQEEDYGEQDLYSLSTVFFVIYV